MLTVVLRGDEEEEGAGKDEDDSRGLLSRPCASHHLQCHGAQRGAVHFFSPAATEESRSDRRAGQAWNSFPAEGQSRAAVPAAIPCLGRDETWESYKERLLCSVWEPREM